ncbi:MAG TPA: S9 family peptidase [Hyphomicrobiaceae bacterium]|jgi:dipeptidyl aminopeptidase/acylaminoacyl peptidase|nr:S9 family peptidase [Hyphomicrobiaceae bacterium]
MPTTAPALPPLIPRAKLFGNPTRAQGQIAPNGRFLSWLAPHDGVLNVWVAPMAAIGEARVITTDKKRGIRFYAWAYSSQHIIYLQDEGGSEDWHIYAVPIDGGPGRDLTPFPGVSARIEQLSLDHPEALAVAINDRDKAWHDLYRIDINTAERQLLFENTGQLGAVLTDRQLIPRLAVKPRGPEGGKVVYRIDGTRLEEMFVVEHEDDLTTQPIGFTHDAATFYSISSIGRDKAALFATAWDSGSARLIAEHPKADISRVISHPVTGVIDAVGAKHLALDWIALSEPMAADLKHLHGALPGEVSIADRSLDDRYWVVAASAAESPTTYHLYRRASGDISELFATQPELKSYTLARMRSSLIISRDGLELPSYYTLPAAEPLRPTEPLPLVLLVHGGPWSRDEYGFNALHQWLANRGFAVLSVNFRASTGFGKAFVNAGDLEWGRKMHEDLLDAVAWAVEEGIADKDRIAIMGGSYGGYATLAGLAFTPDVFCCGVDIVGPSNLETLLATIPPYWAAFFENLVRRVGDPRTEAGRQLLKARSPLYAAGNIKKPLLIGQGANDPRVKQSESDQIIAAMRAKALPVTYVLYPEEGHGFAEPANRIAFFAIAEAFLVQHLGGRAEPIGGDFAGAKFEVPQGADAVPGLTAMRPTA